MIQTDPDLAQTHTSDLEDIFIIVIYTKGTLQKYINNLQDIKRKHKKQIYARIVDIFRGAKKMISFYED